MTDKKYTDLFIDFDDTLYDTRGNAILALAEIFEHFGWERYFDKPDDFYAPYWEANTQLWDLYAKGQIDRDYLIEQRFRRPLSKGTNDDGSAFNPTTEYCLEVSDYFLERCAVKPGLVKGARELMDYLRQRGYRIHMCSNGFHEVQFKKLRSCGLLEYFDTVILSEDAGVNKPSPQFFEYALKQTKAPLDQTIMIGDNLSTDILGAQSVGLPTIYFNRWCRTADGPTPPTYVVDELLEITKIL